MPVEIGRFLRNASTFLSPPVASGDHRQARVRLGARPARLSLVVLALVALAAFVLTAAAGSPTGTTNLPVGNAEVVGWVMPPGVCTSGYAVTVTRVSRFSSQDGVAGKTYCLQSFQAPLPPVSRPRFECPAGLSPQRVPAVLLIDGQSQEVDEVRCMAPGPR